MWQFWFQLFVFLWLSLSVVVGLFICLKNEREDAAYIQIALWLISPLLVGIGILFVKPSSKKQYFKSLKEMLFIK